jgi:predicted Fe-Mo cluster-binding NifX family protein
MKICFPVVQNQGLESEIFAHFGSAPLFLMVDTETREIQEVGNRDQVHAHGQCSPIRALGGMAVEAIVVGGIGGGALRGLQAAGLKVYRSGGATIAENLASLAHAQLDELGSEGTCGGHGRAAGHQHGCSH